MINVVRDNELRAIILRRLNQLSGELSKTKHGFKVIQKLSKTYPEHFQPTHLTSTNLFGTAYYTVKGDQGDSKVQRKYSMHQSNTTHNSFVT